MTQKYKILAYYCYTEIDNPDEFRISHHKVCLDNNLLGRIYIAKEGINGTVSGLSEDCEKYMEIIKNDSRFEKLEFKVHSSDGHAFAKLHVRVKREIVNSGLYHINPNKRTGKYIAPKDLWDHKDAVLLDVRSKYEHSLGKFKNSITLDIENFREFPEKVLELKEKLKDKKIVTICTGNIKCEKASAYLLEQGFSDVYQLQGGIIKYGQETDGRDFEGRCYVFDGRVSVEINKFNPNIASKCYICSCITPKMVNCSNANCNMHVTICDACLEKNEGACSLDCKESPTKREFNGSGYYRKQSNHYNPRKALNCNKRLICE